MSDEFAKAMLGDSHAADPYDGLPPHMRESVPHTARVQVGGRGEPAFASLVQLERDGKPLTKADLQPTWRAGEREGWLKR